VLMKIAMHTMGKGGKERCYFSMAKKGAGQKKREDTHPSTLAAVANQCAVGGKKGKKKITLSNWSLSESLGGRSQKREERDWFHPNHWRTIHEFECGR